MNVLLDSPVEALAFNYVSFGILTVVNNLWTWVAVITAAVSFWRIRAAGAATTSASLSVQTPDRKPSACINGCAQDESRPALEADKKPAPSPASVAEMSAVSSPLSCGDAVTKGMKFKLSVHFEYEAESDDVDGEQTVTEWSDGDGECQEWISCLGGGEWWESWETVLRLRKGETGWHRYQDLTALNGNVVRLWDECRRKHSSSYAVW